MQWSLFLNVRKTGLARFTLNFLGLIKVKSFSLSLYLTMPWHAMGMALPLLTSCAAYIFVFLIVFELFVCYDVNK